MYKVRCKLVEFAGDAATFPCHFEYEIGEEIYYDGVTFTGRICPHMILPMMPVVFGVHVLGQNYCKYMPFRYRGPDIKDPSMAIYDGVGWRPRKELPEALIQKMSIFPMRSKTEWARSSHFMCPDSRTLAHFIVEAVDLSDSEFCAPFYRRAIAILEKIEAEQGIKAGEILSRFTDFEREEISPPLTPVTVKLLLEALEDMNYIKILDGQAFATGRVPPSRPKIG